MYVNNGYGVAACGSRIGRASKTNTDRTGNRGVIYDNHCACCAGEEFTVVNTGNGESIGVVIYLHVEDMSIALIVVKNNGNNYLITNICIHGCCLEYGDITGNGCRIIGGGGRSYATAYDFNIINVDGEHVGYIVMTECDLDVLTEICISRSVNSILRISAGTYKVTKLIAPSCAAVSGDINTNGFCRAVGILTPHVEGDCTACCKFGSNQPVIGSERSHVVYAGLGVHNTETFIYLHACVIHPLPVVTIAIFINRCPAQCHGVFLKCTAGNEVTAGAGGNGSGGSRSGRSGRNHAAGNLNIGCIVLTKEINVEAIGVAAYKLVVVCTTANITLLRCDPDTVAGGGVSNTPVISASGDLNSNGIAANHVLGSEAAICIYGNLIFEFIVKACRCIAAGGQSTGFGNQSTESSCISIKEHLITGTIAPYIFSVENDGSSGSVGITILCLNGNVAVNSTSVIVPAGELIAFMSGRSGEIALIENGACLYGNSTNGAVIETINEGYFKVGHFGSGNFDVGEGKEAGDLCALACIATDMTKGGYLCGLGVNGVKTIVTILIILCPEELVGVHVVGCGLDILHGKSGCANEGKSCGLEVNSEEVAFIAKSITYAIFIDSESHHGLAACKHAYFGKSTECTVYSVQSTAASINITNSIHGVGGVIECHSENLPACIGAGVNRVHTCIGIDVVEAVVIVIAVEAIDHMACGSCCKGVCGRTEVSDHCRIIICELTPNAAGAHRIKCDITDKINGGESFGYGYGSSAGNTAINSGYSDGGGAFGNTTYTTVCIYGSDSFISSGEGNALVVSFSGKYSVLHSCSTICGNGYILNLNRGGVYGFANIYVINSRIVTGLINGAILLVSPLYCMLTCGKSSRIGGPTVYNIPLDEFSAINDEMETIPYGGAAAFS